MLHLRDRLDRRNRRSVLGAERERQLLQLAIVDLAGDRRRFGVDEWRAAADRDLLGDRTDRESRVDSDRLPRFDPERLGSELAEAGQLDVEPVESLRQVLELECARLIGYAVRANVVWTSVSVTVAPGDRTAAVVATPTTAP